MKWWRSKQRVERNDEERAVAAGAYFERIQRASKDRGEQRPRPATDDQGRVAGLATSLHALEILDFAVVLSELCGEWLDRLR